MSTRLIAFIVAVCLAPAAFAQVIYLPVQYQYGGQHKYYYGGSDPHIFARAERDAALLAFRPVSGALPRIYSDLFPYHNAYLFGFRASDAYNEAMRNLPRYFTKADLLDSAVEVDGALVVPPAPPRLAPWAAYPAAPVAPAASPAPRKERKGVIIIIPKKPARPSPEARPAMLVCAGH